MLNLLKTTNGQTGIAGITSIVITGIWFSFELSIAILPAVLSQYGSPFSRGDKGRLSHPAADGG